MKAPVEWLSAYVDLPDSLDDLVQRLIMSGTEIEEIARLGANWNDIVVGLVTEKEIPPGSKHLSVVKIDVGDRTITAVTGAPNIDAGQRVPVVLLGGTVPVGPDGEPVVLQPRPMMGITGEGMVLSERELGMSDEHGGILVLADTAAIGAPLTDVLGGVVIDAEAKGRPDELAIFGIAREIAATTRQDLRPPDVSLPASLTTDSSPSATVRVEAPDLCPRFSVVRVDGITIGPSPSWLSRRLEAAGVRAISNVVDVTNYVMLELGQPLHAYDFMAVPDATLIVRRAEPDECIVTLDGVERALTDDMVLVADPTGPSGVGGIMGGGRSEITDATTSILLEAANWNRVNIRRSSRRLGLRTEASARFERGVPPELTTIAIARCLNLFAGVMEGPLTVHEMVDVQSEIPTISPIQFEPRRVERLLGVEVPTDQMIDSLQRLGFEVSAGDAHVTVLPPYWRRDVEGVADIAEEVARMIGYDRIPERLPGQETPPAPLPPDLRWENRVRETLWGIGLTEAWTDTLTSTDALSRLLPGGPRVQPDVRIRDADQAAASAVAPVTVKDPMPGDSAIAEADWSIVVANPEGIAARGASAAPMTLANAPSGERGVLRNSLVPSLLDVAARNLKHTREHIAFFEIARTFFSHAGDLPYERRTLAIVLAGDRDPRTWNRPAAPYDFFDLKGVVEAVLRLFLTPIESQEAVAKPAPPTDSEALAARHEPQTTDHRRSATNHPALHPGRSALIRVGGTGAGYLGELHPLVAGQFEIEDPIRALVAELDLDALIAHNSSGATTVRAVSRFPAVKRDISLTFPKSVDAETIRRLVLASGGDLLRDIRIVDVYAGEGVDADRRSIAMALEFQSNTETLTQEQVAAIQESTVRRLSDELDAVLRA